MSRAPSPDSHNPPSDDPGAIHTSHWRELILDACQDEAMREEANVILRELAAFNEKYLTGEARP